MEHEKGLDTASVFCTFAKTTKSKGTVIPNVSKLRSKSISVLIKTLLSVYLRSAVSVVE